jgi:hypothetical protein
MHGEDRGGDESSVERKERAQRVPQKQDRGEMQSQVDRVIARRISVTQPVVDPECQVSERPYLERPPELACQKRIIVKMKRAPQASAKCDDSGEA